MELKEELRSTGPYKNEPLLTVARKGQPSYKLNICRTNFIFFGQTLYLSYKFNIFLRNLIFVVQLYICRTNFVFWTNFIFVVQTLHLL